MESTSGMVDEITRGKVTMSELELAADSLVHNEPLTVDADATDRAESKKTDLLEI